MKELRREAKKDKGKIITKQDQHYQIILYCVCVYTHTQQMILQINITYRVPINKEKMEPSLYRKTI